MDSRTLTRILTTHPDTKRVFRGVYSYDNIPDKVHKYPSAYICNTDPSSQPGEHWVAIYFESPQQAEYFDSFGIRPYGKFYKFAKKNATKVMYSREWLQSPDTRVCGLYTLYYLTHRSRGLSLAQILASFEAYSWRSNDRTVFAWTLDEVDV